MPRYRERAVVVGNRRARRIRERLGTELHTIRLDFGLSQAQLARRTEIAQSVVSDIERGRGNYSLEIFCRLGVRSRARSLGSPPVSDRRSLAPR